MTEELLQKIESKMMVLLSEVEVSRQEIEKLKEENAKLKIEKAVCDQKLQNLVSLFDMIEKEVSILPTAHQPSEELTAC